MDIATPMGTNGTVNIKHQMMKDVLTAVSGYRTKSTALRTKLGETVSGLTAADFTGSAAEGFKFFHTSTIEPALKEELEKLLTSIEEMANSILDAIPGEDGLDEQLGNENKK